MARIEPQDPRRLDRADPRERGAIARQLPHDTDVAVPLDVMTPEQMIGLASIIRRPPELSLGPQNVTPETLPAAEKAAIGVQELGRMDVTDLGYRIASLLVRREQDVARSTDAFVKAGFSELEDMARMFEHLMIKRTTAF